MSANCRIVPWVVLLVVIYERINLINLGIPGPNLWTWDTNTRYSASATCARAALIRRTRTGRPKAALATIAVEIRSLR